MSRGWEHASGGGGDCMNGGNNCVAEQNIYYYFKTDFLQASVTSALGLTGWLLLPKSPNKMMNL